MALNTYYTNESTGVKEAKDTIFEDVEGVIQNISPEDTPFLSSIGTSKARSVNHEWLEDVLATPAVNAAVEGADPTMAAITPATRLYNYTQIFSKPFQVSTTMDAVNTIGRSTESAYLLEKSLKELNLDMEYAFINNASAVAGDGSTARKTKGLEGFISTNDKSYATYAATNDFSEAKFLAMAQACYAAGGKPNTLLVPPDQARKISGWNQSSRITVNTNASEKTLVMAVMVLETPFGRVKVVLDLNMVQDDDSGTKYDRVYLFNPSRMSAAYLRPVKTTKLAKTGDSEKYQTIAEAAFVLHNEKAAAKTKKCATD